MALDRHLPAADDVPWSETITAYDEGHLLVYLRLLKMTKADVSESIICREVLAIDPEREPDRARRAFDSHLKRARWMTERGFRELLKKN